MLVSSGHGLPLKDGKVYAGAGYYLNELTVPVRALMKEGYEITFANPKGNTPQLDVKDGLRAAATPAKTLARSCGSPGWSCPKARTGNWPGNSGSPPSNQSNSHAPGHDQPQHPSQAGCPSRARPPGPPGLVKAPTTSPVGAWTGPIWRFRPGFPPAAGPPRHGGRRRR